MLIHNVEVSNVILCYKCGELKGNMPIHEKNYELHCRCDQVESTPREQLPWGYDFAPFVDLCFCCGLTPIKSGVRWSPFFCADCMEMVRLLNTTFGVALIPVGRHSVMNSVALKPGEVTDNEKIREFVANVGTLFHRMGWIHQWRTITVLRTLSELDLPDREDVPFDRYVLHADGAVRYQWKVKAFRRLSAYMDVPDWYFTPDSPSTFLSN